VGHVEPDPQAANKWVAKETVDDNTCDPCRSNNGKLYKNRADAYADYPGGTGYINCIGEEHGNSCRGTVVKRRGGKNVTPELLARLTTIRDLQAKMSAKDFTSVEGPTEKLRMVAAAGAAPTKMYLYDYIGGWDGVSASDVVEALAGVTGDVDLHVNSGGGSIFEGSAIYTTLSNYTGGTLRAHVDGVAASAASLVMLAASEVIVEPAGAVMVHDGSGGVWGTAKDMRAMAEVLDLLSDTIAGIYADRAGGTAAEWRAIMSAGDKWYNAVQAVESGLATRVGTRPGDPPPDDPAVPEDTTHTDLFDAVASIFTAGTRPTRPVAPVPAPPTVDVVGLREALKGMLA
jgi:ATP-dependent protease ClpP protease subunit